MGYYITKINDKHLEQYIGSNTIYSCANNGAFDCSVSKELEELANSDEQIYAIVDKDGIEHCLNVLKSGNVHGRDVEVLTKCIEEKFFDGFMIVG